MKVKYAVVASILLIHNLVYMAIIEDIFNFDVLISVSLFALSCAAVISIVFFKELLFRYKVLGVIIGSATLNPSLETCSSWAIWSINGFAP
jgi:hypothetical protein